MRIASGFASALAIASTLTLASCKSSKNTVSPEAAAGQAAPATVAADPVAVTWTEFATVTLPRLGALDVFVGQVLSKHPMGEVFYQQYSPKIFGHFDADASIDLSLAVSGASEFSMELSLPVHDTSAFFDTMVGFGMNWVASETGDAWTMGKVGAELVDGRLVLSPTSFPDASWKHEMGASARLADANKLLAGHVNFRVVPMELRERIARAMVDNVDTSATGVEAAKQYKQDVRAAESSQVVMEARTFDFSAGVQGERFHMQSRVVAEPGTSLAAEHELNRSIRSRILGLVPASAELMSFGGQRVHLTQEELEFCPESWVVYLEDIMTRVKEGVSAQEDSGVVPEIPTEVVAFITDTLCREDFDPQGVMWLDTEAKQKYGAAVVTTGAGVDLVLAKFWKVAKEGEKKKGKKKQMRLRASRLKSGADYYEFKDTTKTGPLAGMALGMAASDDHVVFVAAKRPRAQAERILAATATSPQGEALPMLFSADLMPVLRLFKNEDGIADLIQRLEGVDLRVNGRSEVSGGAMELNMDISVEALASFGTVFSWIEARKQAKDEAARKAAD